jgi:hypothetical protein
LYESWRFHDADYEEYNFLQFSRNALAFSDETHTSIFYCAECNAAFMFCWKVEVTLSFQMYVNYHRVTRRHNTVDGTKILFTPVFLFIACNHEKYPLKRPY